MSSAISPAGRRPSDWPESGGTPIFTMPWRRPSSMGSGG
jgi:hypothetical protein